VGEELKLGRPALAGVLERKLSLSSMLFNLDEGLDHFSQLLVDVLSVLLVHLSVQIVDLESFLFEL
jgi:hypothetical protein